MRALLVEERSVFAVPERLKMRQRSAKLSDPRSREPTNQLALIAQIGLVKVLLALLVSYAASLENRRAVVFQQEIGRVATRRQNAHSSPPG